MSNLKLTIMKRNVLTMLLALATVLALFGQNRTIADFEEDVSTLPFNKGGMDTAYIVLNPSQTGINTSDSVLRVDKGKTDDGWYFIHFDINPEFNFISHPVLAMKVYSPNAVSFNARIDNDIRWEQQMFSNEFCNIAPSWTVAPGETDTWVEFTVDLGKYPTNRFVSCDLGIAIGDTNEGTYYVDDIMLYEGDPITSGSEVNILYEPCGTFRWVADWANGAAKGWAYWASNKFTPGGSETLSIVNGWNWDTDHTNDLPSDTMAGSSSGPAFNIGPLGTDNNFFSMYNINIEGFDNLRLQFDAAWVNSTATDLELDLMVDIDGSGWTEITGTGYPDNDTAWTVVSAPITGTGSELDIRFMNPEASAAFLIDEIFLKGTQTLVTSIAVDGKDGLDIVTEDGTLQMEATVSPDGARPDVGWSVINGTGEATISGGGVLSGVSAGTVTVRATANDGAGAYGEKEITVQSAAILVTNLTIVHPGPLMVGSNVPITVEVEPANATDKTVTWGTDNPLVAVVVDGILTVIGEGTVQVTATANDGSGITDALDINIPTGIKESAYDKFNIHPNPVGNELYIDNAIDITSVNIYNVTGSLAGTVENTKDRMYIDTSNLNEGIYLMTIRTKDNMVYYSKFIKQ